MNNLLLRFKEQPFTLFLVDGIGAVVSALSLGVVLVLLQEYVGMPTTILYSLASLAVVYAVISFSCYFGRPANWSFWMKVVAYANLFHCIITLGLLFNYSSQITGLGYFYFIVEILIVLAIVRLELLVANHS